MGTPALSRGAKIGILIGVLGTLVGLATTVSMVALFAWPSPPREPLRVRLDPAGPYVILASRRAAEHYAAAIARARELHPEARQVTFDPADLDGARTFLREQ